MSDKPILIVGAGPTGLVLALYLSHHGTPFRIIDKNAGPGLASRAMAVHARTLEFYRQLGFAEDVVGKGIKIETVHLREGKAEVAELALAGMGGGLSPYPFVLGFPQDDHERLLVAKLEARGVSVEWNTALDRFEQDAEGVSAVLLTGGRRETVSAAYLCGCDGAHSAVRAGLKVRFDGGTYKHFYYVADVRLDGRDDDEGTVSIGNDTFALRLPVRSSGMKRLIGMAPAGTDEKSKLTFEDVRASAEGLLDVKVAEVNWFSTYHVHHRVASQFRVGRVFLAGDAGHLHSPTGGQGMNTGIGDAVNLSWKLAAVMKGRADDALLDTYETERIAFARTLVATTDRAFNLVVGGGLGAQVLRRVLVPHVLPFLTGFTAMRQVLFKTVSQTRLNYEDSAISEGKAGTVHGGDRLPWVPGEPANFDALRSLDWQVHVYGETKPALEGAIARLGLPLHRFAWSEAAGAAGLGRDAAYLVRPDGYVALALASQDPAALDRFLARPAMPRFQPKDGWTARLQ